MMNGIQMIDINLLKHHPENPRKDLGDLTELAESIKKNGIMQNLTVVPSETEKDEWLVVIGNRRMEAAKMAGLEELPCVVSFMNHREQIATMLEENMQRADLTVYEQAQGFQMMMDLGYTAAEISEKTGFSRTTVDRRLKMAELDKETFRKAVGKQITMDDLDRIGQLDSVKERNALLKEYGENNFDWKLNRAIKVQKAKKVKGKAHQMLQEAKVEKIPDKERYNLYGGAYERLYKMDVELDKWDGKRNIIPKADGKLYYTEDETDICFYVKKKKQKAEPVKKSEEELEEARQRELAWKTVDRSAETSAELREAFMNGITVSPKNAMRMMQWALIAAFTAMCAYNTPTSTVKRKLDMEDVYNTQDIIEGLKSKIMGMPQNSWPWMILVMFEGDWRGTKGKPPKFADGSRSWQFPQFKKNAAMELCYEWLTEFGYQMSTEEIEMMGGTHPVFQVKMEA